MALETIEGDSIPVSTPAATVQLDAHGIQFYYFARDDRVFRAFADRIDTHRIVIRRHLSRRLKWQLRVLRQVLDGRTTTYSVCEKFPSYPNSILM